MSQYIIDTYIKNGNIVLNNLPFSENTNVKVIVIPKVDLSKFSFEKVQELTKGISGNLSDDIIRERNGE